MSLKSATVFVALWAGAIGAGSWAMTRYETTPGEQGEAPVVWPAGSRLARADSGTTVVVFAHPRCSCTEATLTELAGLMEAGSNRLEAWVVFAVPEGEAASWKQSALVRQAGTMSRTRIHFDAGGVEALRFGALTSGFTVAYGDQGELRLEGGITAARARLGDNPGLRALRGGIERQLRRVQTAVFGCPLGDLLPRDLLPRDPLRGRAL